LLLNGSVFDIAYVSIILLIGFMALAMAVQGADFINPSIHWQRRLAFAISALLLLFPGPKWLDIVGLLILGVAWLPGMVIHRKVLTSSGSD